MAATYFLILQCWLLLSPHVKASDFQEEEEVDIVYKDPQGATCVLLKPRRGAPSLLPTHLDKQFKLIDELTFEDLDVLDVEKLDDDQVGKQWGQQALEWCADAGKYSVVVDKKSDAHDEGRVRSKRAVSYRPGRRQYNYGNRYKNRWNDGRRRRSDDGRSYSNRYPSSTGYDDDSVADRHRSRNIAFNVVNRNGDGHGYGSSPATRFASRRRNGPSPQRHRNGNREMLSDDAGAVAKSFSNTSPIKIDEKGGLNTFSQVQFMTAGSKAEASSNGGMDGRTSDAEVSGSYTDQGTFSAKAKSGFLTGETKVHVEGTDTGSSAESMADIQNLGNAMSKTQLAPKGSAMANAEGNFNDGSTYVESHGNAEGGKSSARANSPGQTSSNAQVVMRGADDDPDNYEGISSARSGGNIRGGQAQTQVQGSHKNKNTYMALANGGFGEYTDNSIGTDSSSSLGVTSIPLENRRRRVNRNEDDYYGRSGNGGDSNYGTNYRNQGTSIGGLAPARLGPSSSRDRTNYFNRGRNQVNAKRSSIRATIPENLRRSSRTGIPSELTSRSGPLNGEDGGISGGNSGGYPRTYPNRRTYFGSNGDRNGALRRNGMSSGRNGDTSPQSLYKSKVGKKACCNAQYICCMSCCSGNENKPQGDTPRQYYRPKQRRQWSSDGRMARRISDASKKRISTLIKHTNELQNDQPTNRRFNRHRSFPMNRQSYRYGQSYKRMNSGLKTTKAPRRMYGVRPARKTYSPRRGYKRTRNYYRVTPSPKHLAKPRIYRPTATSYRTGSKENNSVQSYGSYRNARSNNNTNNKCQVQFKCSYQQRPYGRVRHCRPFKPAGCS